jgi:hypothetical protein
LLQKLKKNYFSLGEVDLRIKTVRPPIDADARKLPGSFENSPETGTPYSGRQHFPNILGSFKEDRLCLALAILSLYD